MRLVCGNIKKIIGLYVVKFMFFTHFWSDIYNSILYIRTVGSFIVEILINGSLPGYIQVYKIKIFTYK